METQYRINYKSDFSFLLVLKDCDGQEIGWPACDWQAKFFTPGNKANAYFASSKGGALTNCYNDGGFIHVVCDNHHLGIGCLNVEFTMLQPNDDFPDGNERKSFSAQLNIELVRENATCEIPKEIKAEVLLSMIHDTDVYAEVLDKVNGVLAGLLDGSGEAGKPKKKVSNFRVSQWLTPGMMRNTARPGMVYDASTGAGYLNNAVPVVRFHTTCVMLLNTRQSSGTIDLSRLFPGGQFGGNEIIIMPRCGTENILDWDYDANTGLLGYKWKIYPQDGGPYKFALAAIFYLKTPQNSADNTQVYIGADGAIHRNTCPVCFQPAPAIKGQLPLGKPRGIGDVVDEAEAEEMCNHSWAISYRPHRMLRLHAPDGRRIEVKYLHQRFLGLQRDVKKRKGFWQHPHGWAFLKKRFLRVRVVTNRGLRTPWHIYRMHNPKGGGATFELVE